MKKFLAMLLTVLMVLGTSATVLASEDITLVVAMIGDGAQKGRLDELMSEYTAETGINVQTMYINGSWGEYCTKIQTMVGGGEQLDLAIVAIEGIEMFVDMGLPASFDDYIAANPETAALIMDDISDDLKSAFEFDGSYYAFPFSWNNVVMHMNKDRFEAAGVELPGSEWSKDEFLAICEQLTVEEDGVKKFAVAVPYNEYFCAEAWLLNNGVSYMNEDFTESTINSPEAVEIFQLWQDLVFEYGYAPVPEPNVSAIQQLINGQVAMGSWGRWPTTNYIDANFTNVAIQYLPNFSTNVPIFGVDGMFVMQNSKYQDEAKALAAWMSQADFEGRYLTTGNIPALKSLAEASISELGIPDNYEIFYEDAMPMKAVSAPIQFSEISSIVLRAISEICVNNADVQETLDATAEEMNAVLAENK